MCPFNIFLERIGHLAMFFAHSQDQTPGPVMIPVCVGHPCKEFEIKDGQYN